MGKYRPKRREKYKLYYTNIVWGYELDLAQNM